jgi:preprotein translocase subunit SecG
VIYLLYTLHVIVCVFLILVVLLQQGKGADLSVFGGGTTQAAFGARGATTLLHKLTVISFAVFILTTLLIGIPQARRSTVIRNVPAADAPAAKPTPTPAAPAGKQQPAQPR